MPHRTKLTTIVRAGTRSRRLYPVQTSRHLGKPSTTAARRPKPSHHRVQRQVVKRRSLGHSRTRRHDNPRRSSPSCKPLRPEFSTRSPPPADTNRDLGIPSSKGFPNLTLPKSSSRDEAGFPTRVCPECVELCHRHRLGSAFESPRPTDRTASEPPDAAHPGNPDAPPRSTPPPADEPSSPAAARSHTRSRPYPRYPAARSQSDPDRTAP